MMKSVRLAGDGGSYRVAAVAGMYKVTPTDPDDAPDAAIAERRIASEMSVGYSPSMGEGLAFAARVAADYLGSRIVFVPRGAGELERGRDAKHRSAGERAFCPGASPPDNSCSPSNKGDGSPREQSLAKKHDLTPKQARWALTMIDKLEKKFAGPGRAAAINEVLSAAKYPKYLKGILQSTPTKGEIEAVMAWSVRRGRVWEPE